MCRPARTAVTLLAAILAALVLGTCGQLPSNPYYGSGLVYSSHNAANPFVYANTASYASTYYLPYAYQSYVPFSPIRT